MDAGRVQKVPAEHLSDHEKGHWRNENLKKIYVQQSRQEDLRIFLPFMRLAGRAAIRNDVA